MEAEFHDPRAGEAGSDVEIAPPAGEETDWTSQMIPNVRQLAPNFLIAGVLPLIGYGLLRPHVSSDAVALMAVLVFPVGEIAWEVVKEARLAVDASLEDAVCDAAGSTRPPCGSSPHALGFAPSRTSSSWARRAWARHSAAPRSHKRGSSYDP